jgi:hypothetical protein
MVVAPRMSGSIASTSTVGFGGGVPSIRSEHPRAPLFFDEVLRDDLSLTNFVSSQGRLPADPIDR